MSMDVNRRSFIKGALAAVGVATAVGLPLPKTALGAESAELATMFDLTKCIGCEACVEACRETNAKLMPEPVKPIPKMFPDRVPIVDWSDRRDVQDRLTPYNWLMVQPVQVEHDGKKVELTIPRRCMHCQNPPCVDLCPFGAAQKLKNGVTRIDPDICLGGAKCQQVCPWEIPQRQSGVGLYLKISAKFVGNGVMFKCNRCYERLEKGQVPACVEVCPEHVQTIGPRAEIIKAAHARAKEIGGYIYGEHENGGTNTIYVSPVPFEAIDQAIRKDQKNAAEKNLKKQLEKTAGMSVDEAALRKKANQGAKQGRPHMGPVEDTMANEENLTAALVLAPIAGAFAAFGKFRNFLNRSTKDEQSGWRLSIMKTQKPTAPGTGFKWLYILSMVVLVFSGFGQMPVFKRYYLADLPLMAWAADFHITMAMHYIAAVVFLAVSAYYLIYLVMSRNQRPKLSASGWVRGLLLLVLVASGFILAARSYAGIAFPVDMLIGVSRAHIIGTFLFLILAATYFRMSGGRVKAIRQEYLKARAYRIRSRIIMDLRQGRFMNRPFEHAGER